jgi:uncharacterized protein Veg
MKVSCAVKRPAPHCSAGRKHKSQPHLQHRFRLCAPALEAHSYFSHNEGGLSPPLSPKIQHWNQRSLFSSLGPPDTKCALITANCSQRMNCLQAGILKTKLPTTWNVHQATKEDIFLQLKNGRRKELQHQENQITLFNKLFIITQFKRNHFLYTIQYPFLKTPGKLRM